jgi:hypothetical protein
MSAQPIASQPVASSGVREFSARKPRLLINGQWVEARSGEHGHAVIDLYTELKSVCMLV